MSDWAQGTVMVLGAQGMLARDLSPKLRERLDVSRGKLVALDHQALDITVREKVLVEIAKARPHVVINCAAYTDVDGAESNVDQAMRANAEGPAYIAEACRAVDALLVHYSTDFVFDGAKSTPYSVGDAASPLSVYGRSKFSGARAVCTSGCRHLVIRTSWLYGPFGRNFVEAILGKACQGESLKVVTDQVGRPTYTVDLSEATLRLLDAGADGLVHFANGGHCSWHEFAVEIVKNAGLDTKLGTLTSRELARPAARPAYSVLDLSSYIDTTGHTPRHWKEALADYMNRRKAEGKAA